MRHQQLQPHNDPGYIETVLKQIEGVIAEHSDADRLNKHLDVNIVSFR